MKKCLVLILSLAFVFFNHHNLLAESKGDHDFQGLKGRPVPVAPQSEGSGATCQKSTPKTEEEERAYLLASFQTTLNQERATLLQDKLTLAKAKFEIDNTTYWTNPMLWQAAIFVPVGLLAARYGLKTAVYDEGAVMTIGGVTAAMSGLSAVTAALAIPARKRAVKEEIGQLEIKISEREKKIQSQENRLNEFKRNPSSK